MKTQFCALLAIVSTGILAGIFFTWTNAVTPGIGKLDALSYLSALKSMNKSILNPMFLFVFFLPLITIPLTAFFTYDSAGAFEWSIICLSALLYATGCVGVTISGNVPLNELLENSDLVNNSAQQLAQLRASIEGKWNLFNLIRTIASAGSFSLLVIALCLKK